VPTLVLIAWQWSRNRQQPELREPLTAGE